MQARGRAAAIFLAWSVAGCAATNDYGSSTTGGRRPTTGGVPGTVAAASTSTSGSGTSGTATGNTGTQGSTTGTSCPAQPDSALTDCGDAGLLEIRSFLVDAAAAFAGNREQPVEASLAISDLNDPGGSTHSDSCGQFYFCEPAGHVLSMFFDADAYTPLIAQDIAVERSLFYSTGSPIFQSNTLSLFLASLNPSFDAAQSSVLISVQNPNPCNPAGWTFALDAGGTLVQGDTAYLVGSTFESQETQTALDGVVLLYNLGSFTGDVSVVGTEDPTTYSSSVGPCYTSGAGTEYDGNIHLQPGATSNFYFLVYPDAG